MVCDDGERALTAPFGARQSQRRFDGQVEAVQGRRTGDRVRIVHRRQHDLWIEHDGGGPRAGGGVHRAQRCVPLEHIGDRSAEDGEVEVRRQRYLEGDIVGDRGRIVSILQPDSALGRCQAGVGTSIWAMHQGGQRDVVLRERLHCGGEQCGGG